MADYPNFAGEAQFLDTASVPTPPANNLAVYSDGGVLKTKNSSGTVTTLGAADLASPSAIGSTTPNTGAFTTLSFAPAANATGLSSSSYSLTGSNAQSLVSLSGTWNTTGTPTGILFNMTDTASNANSRFLEFQVGGSARVRVKKRGTTFINCGVLPSNPSGLGTGGAGLGLELGFELYGLGCNGNGHLVFIENQNPKAVLSHTMQVNDVGYYGWASGDSVHTNVTKDLFLRRDAAGILAQYNATNAQAFRIYNTYSSSGTNFERVNFGWASSEFIIDASNGGTGSLRGIKLGSATTSLLGFYGVTPVDQPATVTDPTGGGTIDTEARTAINAIIDRLQELGLIA